MGAQGNVGAAVSEHCTYKNMYQLLFDTCGFLFVEELVLIV